MSISNRCSRCVLPESTPGLVFDDDNVCSDCRTYQKIVLKGEAELLTAINNYVKKDSEYDCIVNISGGRDSSYTILKMVKDYKLNVLAVNYDNPVTHPVAKQNITNIQKILGVKLVSFSFKPGFHEKILRLNLRALLAKPDPGMVPMVCVSCKLMWKNILDIARSHKVKLLVSGGNFYEQVSFKRFLLGGNQNQELRSYYSKYVFGLAGRALRNIRFLRPGTLIPTIQGYLYNNPYSPMVRVRGRDLARIDLFHYIPWDEKEVLGRIQDELDWQYPSDGSGSWRFDCKIGRLKDFFYMKTLGLTEKDDFYSRLIREGKITRSEALKRLETENETNVDVLKDLMKSINMDFSELEKLNYSRSGR